MTTRKKQEAPPKHHVRNGAMLIGCGALMNTFLAVLNTALQNYELVGKDQVVEVFKIELSGWAFSIPALFMVGGFMLVMLKYLGYLVRQSKWGRR